MGIVGKSNGNCGNYGKTCKPVALGRKPVALGRKPVTHRPETRDPYGKKASWAQCIKRFSAFYINVGLDSNRPRSGLVVKIQKKVKKIQEKVILMQFKKIQKKVILDTKKYKKDTIDLIQKKVNLNTRKI